MNSENFYRYIFPVSLRGKWCIALIGFFMLFLLLHNILIFSGQRGGETFFSNPWLSGSLGAAALVAIASFVTGLIAIIKDKERSLFVILCSLIGLMILTGVVGIVFFPGQ